jgi:hypothetical protein
MTKEKSSHIYPNFKILSTINLSITTNLKKYLHSKINIICQLHFFTIIKYPDLDQDMRGDVIYFLKVALPRKFRDIKIITTTEIEIKSIIHYLKDKNSSGF